MPIMFKTGLDDTDFQKGLDRMAKSANNYAEDISSKMRNIESQARFGGKNPFDQRQHVAHLGARVAGDAINAITGQTGAVMELRALQGLSGATLGVAAAVVIAYKAWEAYSESIKKVRELSDEAAKSIIGNITALGAEAVSKKIEENTALADKMKASRGFASNLNSFLGGSANKDSLKEEYKLRAEANDQREKEVAFIKAQTAAQERAVGMSEKERTIQEVNAKLAERRAKIPLLVGVGLREAEMRKAESAAAIDIEAAEKKEDALVREASLEHQINDIKREGFNVDQLVHKAKQDAFGVANEEATNDDQRRNIAVARDKEDTEYQIANREKIQEANRKQFEEFTEYQNKQDKAIREVQDAEYQGFLRFEAAKAKAAREDMREAAKDRIDRLENTANDLATIRQHSIDRALMTPAQRRAQDKADKAERKAGEKFDKQHPEIAQAIEAAKAMAKAFSGQLKAEIAKESMTALALAIGNEIDKVIAR